MLFDIGWTEMLLIGVIALVVIGPKDLPRAMRTAGYWMRKARTLSREFQNSIDQMIREAELDEVQQELKKATEFDIGKELQNTVDPDGSLAESVKPPDVPDYLDPAPDATEPNATEPVAELSAPTETALPDPGAFDDGTPEPAVPPPGSPEPSSISSELTGPSAEASEPVPEPAPAPAPAPKTPQP
jgi:sec-independent protein translocase protein TatB